MKNNLSFESSLNVFQEIFNNEKFFQIFSSLSEIILLILIFSWLLKKMSAFKINNIMSCMKILDRLSVGPHESIILVEIQDIKLILGVTTKQITHLHTFSSILKNQSIQDVPIKKMDNILLKKKTFNDFIKNFSKKFWKKTMFYRIISILFLFLLCPTVQAEIPGITSHALEDGGQTWSVPVQTLVFLTSLTFLPAFLIMMTSFTRIIIVFSLLRNALGTPYIPSNQILLGLALFLTFFIMSPTFDKIYKEAYIPFSEEKLNMEDAIVKGAGPLKNFMLNQTRTTDLELFSKLAHISSYKDKYDIPLRILLPSFITSELKTAFQIGFTIFIPFLIIDLVVASVLMALGMMMVPPSTISLPFKLMLFVLVDGWQLLITSLAQSFNT
ncbi:flagellar biosynthetic protein FliP [Buchnera aphidicola (Macrosiphoniella sanborni)]|uniref:Flagellar biosynthetic protein FliP n=1 Tax=Buchnera aphidicola (Macrosiphoniella sanborni) TaxID=1241865 RepID=A0A4D6Y3Q9_9GAMM|nr:flagellar type III secretion system pore protein FliP [Buchnera aphidicola]QCI23649.1 flagellar biosynthetic protein FliP [Buchnera aphidicola (Macrosiphoniella sanborni)]